MTITQIEVFVKVVKLKNFTRVGDEIGMTQSAVSHAISNLEKHLGVKLLERSRNGVTLTTHGENAYIHMKEILKKIRMIYNDIQPTTILPECTIKIGTFPSIATSILPKIIRAFTQTYPQVEIVLFEGTDQEILEWIEMEIVDLGFIILPNTSYNSTFITQDELYAILPQNHILVNSNTLSMTQLQFDPFILSKGGCEPLIRTTTSHHNSILNIKYEVNNISTIIEMVKEQLGITLMPSLALNNMLLDGIVTRPLKPPVYRKLALASKKDIEDNLVLKSFVEKAKFVAHTSDF